MATTSNTSVLANAVKLLKECYGQMGAEPDMETDGFGELINPASEELFESLDNFLKDITGLTGKDFRTWVLSEDLDQNSKNEEHYY